MLQNERLLARVGFDIWQTTDLRLSYPCTGIPVPLYRYTRVRTARSGVRPKLSGEDPEVPDLHHPVPEEEEVERLQVPVDDVLAEFTSALDPAPTTTHTRAATHRNRRRSLSFQKC